METPGDWIMLCVVVVITIALIEYGWGLRK